MCFICKAVWNVGIDLLHWLHIKPSWIYTCYGLHKRLHSSFIVLAGAWERGDMHFNLHVCTGKCREKTDCFSFRISPHQSWFGKEERKPRIENDLWVAEYSLLLLQWATFPSFFVKRLCYSETCSFLLVSPVFPLSYFIWVFRPEFPSLGRRKPSDFHGQFMHVCSYSRNISEVA